MNETALTAASRPSSGRTPLSSIADTWSALALTPALTVALVPNWWTDPLRGIAIFLWSNLSRQATTWIPTQFFGNVYEFSLPWYNSIAWIALTVPPLTLLFMLVGILSVWSSGRADRRCMTNSGMESVSSGGDPSVFHFLADSVSLGWLLFLNASTLLIIRALPGSPGHDGERQLLGSFPFLACLSGLGVVWLKGKLSRMSPGWASRLVRATVVLSVVWSAGAIWHYRAAPLSYYTELIGGLRGAARLGLEPTYYWDALDRQTIEWLNRNTGPSERVQFCNYFESLGYLRSWGILRTEILPTEPGVTRWYVLQNRPGLFAWNPVDGRWLAEHGRPAYTHELDGVPLIWIFPIQEYERALQEARRETH